MKILHVMLSPGKGGIEQAFLDHTSALLERGHSVTCIARKNAAVIPLLGGRVKIIPLRSTSRWNPLAFISARRIAKREKADVILCHGSRAVTFMHGAKGKSPLIGVMHNYWLKRLMKCDALLSVTQDLINEARANGYTKPLHHVPNMLHTIPPFQNRHFHKPPIIGTMGRFVEKKGFHVLLEAAKIMKEKQLKFRILIGGEGDEKKLLKKQALDLAVSDCVSFIGWVEHKKIFYDAIDIFCLPSLHEPFGIVLLEAMAQSLPVVSTYTEGPRDIITHAKTGLMVEPGKADQLATALEKMLKSEEKAMKLAAAAHASLDRFSAAHVGDMLVAALEDIQKTH